MGWVGVALKKHVVHFNDPLAVGLSTGLCGSLTTFAAWNQMVLQMVDRGLWVRGLSTYFFGTEDRFHQIAHVTCSGSLSAAVRSA